MIFDHKRRIMYCPIPKIALSTWMVVMVNNTDTRKKPSLKTLLSPEYIHYHRFSGIKKAFYNESKHGHYTKFMVVRHPFDRLVSAYYNKAFPQLKWDGKYLKAMYKNIQKYAFAHFPHPELSERDQKFYNATFKEFVEFTLKINDHHWNSLRLFCDPCKIKYDYILRMETMQRDSQVLMRDLYPTAGPIPVANAARNIAKTNNITSTFVQPKTLEIFSQLSSNTLQKVFKKHDFDLAFYGYSFNSTSFKAECRVWEQNCC